MLNFRNALLLAASLWAMACTSEKKEEKMKELDIQGHRGARGLLPENTIPGFLKALELGVTTLELDLAVSRDGKLVVSHEPWMNPAICLDPQGDTIPREDGQKHNIYQLTHDEIKQFDCGSMGNSRFPDQQPMKVYKPSLEEVFDAVDKHIAENGIEKLPNYNIEIKSMPAGDSIFHPTPGEFSDLVYTFIDGRMDWSRVNIQSFDFRVLQYFRANYPNVKLAVLIENEDSIDQNLQSLGFQPEIYSCWYKLLTAEGVSKLQNGGIQVIPWTVNELPDMQELVNWGVDGIITDYPDRALQLN